MGSPTSRSKTWRLGSPEATRRWGRRFARLLCASDTVALIGDMGAGKTTLIQGIAEGWGCKGQAQSPTFALANEYKSRRGLLIHMDLYRLSERELEQFPLEDYFGAGPIVIEWADRARHRWPQGTLEIRLRNRGFLERELQVVNPSLYWKKRMSGMES